MLCAGGTSNIVMNDFPSSLKGNSSRYNSVASFRFKTASLLKKYLHPAQVHLLKCWVTETFIYMLEINNIMLEESNNMLEKNHRGVDHE